VRFFKRAMNCRGTQETIDLEFKRTKAARNKIKI
jgi:hypothetical protein